MGASSPSSFEFLEYAPRRFDGGPEVEWIHWLEEQHHHGVQVALHRHEAMDDLMAIEQDRLLDIRHSDTMTGVEMLEPTFNHFDELTMPVPSPAKNDGLLGALLTPFFNVALSICGIFVSTVLFQVLFRGLPAHRKQYDSHNQQVYKQSKAVLKDSLIRVAMTPATILAYCFR